MPVNEEDVIDDVIEDGNYGLTDEQNSELADLLEETASGLIEDEVDRLNEEHQLKNQDACTQKKGGAWPNISPFNGGPYPTRTWSRFLPQCPNYNNYSQYQLDMRRKADVLQYKNNRSNRTKKSRYAYLAKSNNSVIFGSPDHTNANCIKSTRDSNVPGPSMNLFIDNSVPVFGLRSVRTYGNSGSKDDKLVKLPTNINDIDVINHHVNVNHNTLKTLQFLR